MESNKNKSSKKFVPELKDYGGGCNDTKTEIFAVGCMVARLNRNVCTLIEQLNYIIDKLENKGII